MALIASVPAARADEHLSAAEEALARGETAVAARALALASIYVDSPLWAAAYPEDARSGARAREARLAAELAALRIVDERSPQAEAARAALARARSVRPSSPAGFAAAVASARACAAPVPPDVDAAWIGPHGSLADLVAGCRALADQAAAGEAQAAAEAAALDRTFRDALHGDRLSIYLRYGAPIDPGSPEAAVRAPMWTYEIGPAGAPGDTVRLVLTFRGDRLVGRRRVRHAR
jgi:hypothetical protein